MLLGVLPELEELLIQELFFLDDVEDLFGLGLENGDGLLHLVLFGLHRL